MRALLQRVSQARVRVEGRLLSETGPGLLVFLGIGQEATQDKARRLADKIINLRIFGDEQGKMNLSLKDVSGSMLVVSQFTLWADSRKGNRPSFNRAGHGEEARRLYEYFSAYVKEQGIVTGLGEFGAEMEVELVNNGPVTIWLEM